jgi:spore coat protein U-like protein
MNVSATIGKSCTAPNSPTVTLPDYNGTDRPQSATVTFKCTKGTRYTVELFPGNGTTKSSSGTLKSARNTTPINYTITGRGGTPIDSVTGRGNGLSDNVTDSAVTPYIHPTAGQDPEPGSYSDTIGVKVSY